MDYFMPPKPEHRDHNMPVWKRLITGSSRDMLENYTERAYSYLMGKNSTGLGVVFAINCLDSVRTVLVDKSDDFPKSEIMLRSMEPLIGRSVFSVNGEEWKAQRKRLAPAFSHLHVKRGFAQMQGAVERILEDFEQSVNSGAPLDLEVMMSQVTSDVIFRVMFSENIDSARGNAIYENFQTFQQEQQYFSLRTLFNWPSWLPYLGQRHNKKAMDAAAVIRGVIEEVVANRVKTPVQDRPKDMLTAILAEYEQDFPEGVPEREVVDQIAFFFLAGHETTASGTTWAHWLISEAPAVEEKLLAEIAALVGDRPLEYSDISKLKYVDACFKEAMRLYPPVPYFPRRSNKDIKIRTHQLKPGSQCTVNAYFIHRNTRWWTDPDLFKPERFLEAGGCPADKMAYIPFSAGPRVCPGANFATVESILLLAMVFRQYRLKLVEGHKVAPSAQLTLRTKHGVLVHVEKR